MANLLSFLLPFLQSTSVFPADIKFVDLGLPSGTLWSTENTAGRLPRIFKPTTRDFYELQACCEWIWNGPENSWRVKGPSGKHIELPAAGCPPYGKKAKPGTLLFGGVYRCRGFLRRALIITGSTKPRKGQLDKKPAARAVYKNNNKIKIIKIR